jgi:hypothetical protein
MLILLGRASTGTNALQFIIPSRVRWPVKLFRWGDVKLPE